jgi:hypothetical protein
MSSNTVDLNQLSSNTVDLTDTSSLGEEAAAEVMASWTYPTEGNTSAGGWTDCGGSGRVWHVSATGASERDDQKIRRICRKEIRRSLSSKEKYATLLEQERDRLERENQQLRDKLREVRIQNFGNPGEGWSCHLSYTARPGEWYWYHSGTGQRLWEDWTEVDDEPNWWTLDDWRIGLTQFFHNHCPGMVDQVEQFLARWAGDEWGMWEYVVSEYTDYDWCDDNDIYWCREELLASHYTWYRCLGYTESQSELLASRRC